MSPRPYILPEYHMVLEGLMPPPSEQRYDELHILTYNWTAVQDTAVQKIWEAVLWNQGHQRGDWQSCWDYLWENLLPRYRRNMTMKQKAARRDKAHLAGMSLALDIAKVDVRYWGIYDPAEQSYCSYCKRPKPVDMFNQSRFTCDECFAKREETYDDE
jgi:hypothetical protein